MLVLKRFTGGVSAQLFRRIQYATYSTSVRSAGLTATQKPGDISTQDPVERETSTSGDDHTDVNAKKSKSSLVAAAFESLKEDSYTKEKSKTTDSKGRNSLDERIHNAKTVNGLLSVSELSGPLSRKQALKIVSKLSEWSSINRAKIAEFENDARFLRVCRVLGRTMGKDGSGNENNGPKRISGFRTDDLNTVLGVAGDDEAAKLIASISLPQMVKVMSTLAQRKRRSTPLLRSLAFNISSTTEQLDLKQSADVLYAMATLNFQDSVLAAKICSDIQTALPKNTEKSAVVGSILTSLGILKYRDLDIMEALTQWTLKNSEICRPQDISALFITSAILNFKSSFIDDVSKKLTTSIVGADFQKCNDWLNHVWSLAMLGLVSHEQLTSVLSENFVEKLEADRNVLSPTSKMKLLNLNAYAQHLASDYKGTLLPEDSAVFRVPLAHSKSKQILINGMLDALKSLLPASNHLKSLHDSKMGFLIDALCLFDHKRNPLPVDKENPNAIKIALMVVDFHDVCHGTHRSASGITNLSFNLLEKSGYKVVPVPYNEFNTSDKLLKRVQYLEAKFKAIISSNV
ncbi:PREDICTED: protein TBRG4 [Bactrocera latifrons]|uniref:Protein TBRG4 n=1 Tax=Bactrocera latifrons TaxID=174628 RepID=A0A0K8WKD2_BACLA|nr:PREDICTED: protein TBRG4 [Bactrocera latifrons]XP_018804738.1 PREDICTED: protein TBRG4 [Bactrocera latifrons]XP_018804739.1 PREDICTED: protein TBRG4 [Bactrocera latifrons]XP_018804741.1 PREDICTED: protein TBRG4 [Bactrocera latifrons]